MTADHKDNDRTTSLGDSDSNSDRPRIKKLGHFRIDTVLGSGGMGTIYLAYDESMKRTVALKVLHSSLGISERAQTRFVREAWIAGQLDHPNIVRVYSRGEDKDISFLAMELAEGGSLSDHIQTMRKSIPQGSDVTGSIDQEYISDILEKFIGLSRALDHIHGQGFIHRDIKPHNILLSGPEKTFKLTDFGLAHADDMTRMTRAGDFIGTVKYMSPELLAAHRAGIDKRTDIYSMGVTLYEALTLELPFRADSQEKLIGEILAGRYREARQTNRRIPVDLETVLMKACHHDPHLRYQTAGEFAEDLQRIIDGRPILARRQSAISRGIKYLRRNYKVASIISLSVIVVAGSFLWQNYRTRKVDIEEMSVRMVWSGDDVSANGMVSSDGAFLPFTDWEMGNLAVRQLVSGETRYLTDDGGWDYPMRFADQPVVSPDRELIAYVWWTEADPSGEDSGTTSGDLCLINPNGTNRRVLVDAGLYEELWPSSFSPDGVHIAVHLYDSAANQQIVLVSTDDGSLQILKVMGDHWNWSDKMDFSADGQYLVYHVTVEGAPAHKDVFLLAIDGSGEVPLIQHPANDQLLGWVPGSNSVLFLSDRSGNWDAWVVEVADGRPMDEPQLVRKNMGDIQPMGFTRDSAFYYDANTRWLTASTGRIDSVTGKIVTPLQEPLAGSGSVLSWSPDGEYVAFVAEQNAPAQPGGRRDILYVRSASTGKQRELSSQHDRVSQRVHWSPDSRYLLVRGIDAGDLYGPGQAPYSLSLIDVETGDETLIVDGISRASMGGVWSPDGESIYYIDRDSLVMRDLASGRQEVLYRGESWLNNWLALSPDGEQLLVGVRRDSCDCILVLSLSTGETRELFRNTKSDFLLVRSFEWTPDGRHVLFLLLENPNEGPTSLWRIPAEGGTAEKILQSRKLLSGLSVHPDGDQVSFTNFTRSSEVWVMENFLPEDTLER